MEKAGLIFVKEYAEADDFIVVKYALTSQAYFGE